MLPTSVHPGYLTVTVDSTVKSVILVQKGMNYGSAVAYLDGGMIYSHDNGTSIRTNIVLRNCLPGHVDSALMKVYYTDISDPFNPVNDSVLFQFDTVKVAEGYLLETRDMVRFAGAVRVNKITLDIPNVYISFMDSTTHNVSRGQSLVFNCDWDIDYFGTIPKPVSASYDINYALESVSIDGDGRILQHRTGDSVTYSYDFYLKDHLGSTRMVFNDQQSVTEKINYQSYGTINPLDSSSPALPSREKFTGKEYDTQGADFARVEFDITVREFDMSSGSGFIRVSYRDVATGTEFSKIYMVRYDSKNRALRFTGSESFTGEIEIEQMFLMASGAPGGIFNIVPIDSFLVSLGKTRKIQLDVASSEIVGAPIDTNFYSVHASVDNRSYFSGTRLYYFGARFYDPELGVWLSVDPAEQFWNLYGYHNNPVLFVDPNGTIFGIDDLLAAVIVGAVIGAVSNYVSYGVQTGEWGSGQAFAMAGIGLLAGAATVATGGAASAALPASFAASTAGSMVIGAAGGIVGGAVGGIGGYSVGAAYGDYAWNGSAAFGAMGMGALSGMAGGAAGGAASSGIGNISINGTNLASPVLKGVVGGAAGGYAGGFTGGLIASHGDLRQANNAGLGGMAMGATAGGAGGYLSAKANNINPWTGRPNTTLSSLSLQPRPGESTKTLYRGMTGNEGKGPLYLAEDPSYANGYIQNGGKLTGYNVSETNFKAMQYEGYIQKLNGYNSTTGQYGTEYRVNDPLIINDLLNLGKEIKF